MTHRSPFIVFADADLSWSRSLRHTLRRRDARVFTATNASDFLDLAARLQPDLAVVADDLDPGGSVKLLELLRGRSPATAVALLSARPEEERHPATRMVFVGPRPPEVAAVASEINGWLTRRLYDEPARPGTPRVLCVDDDPLFLKGLVRTLERRGYRTAAFTDAARALAAIPELTPDLAILDIMMPGLDGLQALDRIRERRGASLPVVLLSAKSSHEDLVDGYRRGAAYYLAKPCEPRALLNIVDYLAGDLDESERQLIEAQL